MKIIPQYNEMTPGRLEGKINGLAIYIDLNQKYDKLDAYHLLCSIVYTGFYNREGGLERRYDLEYWNRLETFIERGFHADRP